MKALHIFCLLIFFLLNLKAIDSFSQQSVFTQVPPPGVGWSSEVITGSQDPKGYMWFGANGLHRYDGYSYKSYFHDPLNPSSLVYNHTEVICADHKGFIWVATNKMGLDRLDPETAIFTHFRHNPSDPNSISSDVISAILEDRDGKIWVGTENAGLNCIDPKTGTIIRFRHDPKDINSLSYDKVTTLYEDHQGTIWVGTGFLWHLGDLRLRDSTLKQGGLNRFNRANKNFTRYLHDPNDASSLIDNRVKAIFEDSKGRFWVGTSGDGLHTMNREKGSFERHQYNSSDSNSLSRPPVKNTMPWADDMITFIREDVAGTIWIGTLMGGLNRYDPQTRKISHYASLNERSTDKNNVSNFSGSYTSKDGVLWIFTWDGVYHMDPLHKQIPHYDIGSPVSKLLQDGTGKLWMATDKGLIVSDSAIANKKVFVHYTSDTMSLSSTYVKSIFEDRKGAIWIGTDKGVNRYEQQSEKFTHYLDKDDINVIYEDKKGSFWIGTVGGLVLMNRKDTTFTYYRHSKTDTTSLSQNAISSIREGRSGNLWIGTQEGGLNRFDKRSKKFQHYLPGTNIQSIIEDKDSVLWIGTGRGLYYFRPSSNSFVLYTNQGSGFTGNTFIYQILEDDQQSLWINTNINIGLFRLRHNRNDVSFFGKRYVSLGATQNNCFKGIGGELFFGDNLGDGYYAFFPEQIQENPTAPDLHITGFRLGDQLVDSFKQTNEIRLPYNQNVFSFYFAGLHYSSPEDNQHMFMLENLDNDWRKAGEEKTASYYNVPPGKYIFRVKAANSDGIWAEKSIVVIISPPWWKTWWAYILYGLLFIAGLIVTDRIRRRQLINKERARVKDQELAQAKEIKKAYDELNATQAQLIQREKMASLGELTAGIAHEIQNPLNFVNNFSEVSKELIDEMNAELDKGDVNEVKVIATNIKENLEKINHHGKRADAIVKGMLQHSRVSTGQQEPTNINALADEYLRLSYHGMRAKDKEFNATIKTDFDEAIGKVNIIPQDIGRVLLNLYNNAFYAVGEKKKQQGEGYEPIISVSTKKLSSPSGDGGKVEVRVKDNGNGIPQKIIDKIFQPFFTTKPTGQGTGLGLSLSYDIIKAHGGEIKVESKEGVGTAFIIQIPFV